MPDLNAGSVKLLERPLPQKMILIVYLLPQKNYPRKDYYLNHAAKP
jgi:hypothetical protein